MPTYDYKCPKCSKIKEVKCGATIQSVLFQCDNCYEIMERQVSKPAGVHFKGSGFYETDYKGK